MSYRDELEAAQARADAAERRLALLEKRLVETDEPMLVKPSRFKVVSTVHELTVRWGWWSKMDVGLLAMIVVFGLGVLKGPTPPAVLVMFFVGGGAVLLSVLLNFVNYTAIRVVGEELSVRHAPVPWFGNRTLRIADVKQLYVEEIRRPNDNITTHSYKLCALVDNDNELALLSKLRTKGEAQYLEQLFERRLRIKDRRLVGEAPK